MSKKILRIATRQSELALWQTNWVADQLKAKDSDLEVELVKITTKGDKILDKSLAKIGGKGLFVKELEQAILDNRADIAVHSLKDMPAEQPDGLELAVYCKRADFRDVFISKSHYDLASLPLGSRIGTSSVRRMAQLRQYRKDLEIVPLRGNINTRIDKAYDEAENLDGILLASAGVNRLEKQDIIRQYLPINGFLPAPGQGIVVVETRKNDHATKDILNKIKCPDATVCAYTERAFNRIMGGSCQIPIAAYAEIIAEDTILLHGQIASLDGVQLISSTIKGRFKQAVDLGEQLAHEILNSGGKKIIEDLLSDES